MKRLFIISLLAVLAFAGCKDFLVEEPLLSNSNELQLSDYNGIKSAVFGAYAPLASSTWYGANFILNSEMRAGNAQIPFNSEFRSGRMTVPYYLTYDEDITEGLWGTGYFVISAANNAIDAIDEIGESLINQFVTRQDLDNLKAEALFLRALAHFDMLRLYCKNTKPELGIPVILKTDKTAKEQPARDDMATVYGQIETDLETAARLIDPSYSREGVADPTAVASLNAIYALLARVYLYDASFSKAAEKYQKAADYATFVINSGDYRMWTVKEYPSVWKQESFAGGEVIFSVYGIKSNTYDGYWDGPSQMTNPLGYADCAATTALTSLFAEGDVRGTTGVRTKDDENAMFCTDPDEKSGGQLWTMKYRGKGNGDAINTPDVNNTVVLRLSEMYLIRAEAIVKGAKVDGVSAVDDINKIRENRGVAPVGAAGEGTVADERRMELNFEGHLWFDLARTTRTITYSDGKERNREAGISADSPLWALPIPKRERDVNPNLVQNDLE